MDLGAVAELLARGFPDRSPAFWRRALERLAGHPTPPGYARFGYVLEAGTALVGVLLTIHTDLGPRLGIRCNLSSWYAEPGFRAFATMLVSAAVRDRTVTYINISPAPNTRPITEAQGFVAYSRGVFATVPALAPGRDERVRVVAAREGPPGAVCDEAERALLTAHSGYGCLSVWCVADGQAHPFVFVRRPALRGLVPTVQLAYCRDVGSFVRFARPLGRHLLRRGVLAVTVDANGALPGLPGSFRPGKVVRLYRGETPPRLGDLAYTELALFGS